MLCPGAHGAPPMSRATNTHTTVQPLPALSSDTWPFPSHAFCLLAPRSLSLPSPHTPHFISCSPMGDADAVARPLAPMLSRSSAHGPCRPSPCLLQSLEPIAAIAYNPSAPALPPIGCQTATQTTTAVCFLLAMYLLPSAEPGAINHPVKKHLLSTGETSSRVLSKVGVQFAAALLGKLYCLCLHSRQLPLRLPLFRRECLRRGTN